jgi:hypothetical protein
MAFLQGNEVQHISLLDSDSDVEFVKEEVFGDVEFVREEFPTSPLTFNRNDPNFARSNAVGHTTSSSVILSATRSQSILYNNSVSNALVAAFGQSSSTVQLSCQVSTHHSSQLLLADSKPTHTEGRYTAPNASLTSVVAHSYVVESNATIDDDATASTNRRSSGDALADTGCGSILVCSGEVQSACGESGNSSDGDRSCSSSTEPGRTAKKAARAGKKRMRLGQRAEPGRDALMQARRPKQAEGFGMVRRGTLLRKPPPSLTHACLSFSPHPTSDRPGAGAQPGGGGASPPRRRHRR